MYNLFVESHFKDNPALSMLNDSDDEVVYGYVADYDIYIAECNRYICGKI